MCHISKCSPDEVVGYIAKAKNAAQNALWSIERAYLPPCKGAPAAFILITCLIDFLGTLYAGRDSNRGTFTAFVSDFMRQQQDGVGYDGEELWKSLRNKLVHNYSIWQGKYVLTHGHPELHLRLHSDKARILNLEDFFEYVKCVRDDHLTQVAQETELRERLADRISTFCDSRSGSSRGGNIGIITVNAATRRSDRAATRFAKRHVRGCWQGSDWHRKMAAFAGVQRS